MLQDIVEAPCCNQKLMDGSSNVCLDMYESYEATVLHEIRAIQVAEVLTKRR